MNKLKFQELSKLLFDEGVLLIDDPSDNFHVIGFQTREKLGVFDDIHDLVKFIELTIDDKANGLISWLNHYWLELHGNLIVMVDSHD